MAVSGVRSSCEASATNWRIRSSDRRAAASERLRASKDDSIWASMVFSDRPSRPTSVCGSRSGTRRDRSPAAMASAVCSMSLSGRRLLRTIAMPTTASARMMARLTSASIRDSWPIVPLMSPRSTPAISVADWLLCPRKSLVVMVIFVVITCQLSPPEMAGTLTTLFWLAASHDALVGTSGRDVVEENPCCAA